MNKSRSILRKSTTCGFTRRLRIVALAALLPAIIAGCEHIRKATYPQDFVYLGSDQVTSKMMSMAFYMRQLDNILLDNSTINSEQQAQIVKILASIDAQAESLAAGNVATNHLVIDTHIDQFKSDVALALHDARSDPPNYFALGKLSGSCNGCHKYRRK